MNQAPALDPTVRILQDDFGTSIFDTMTERFSDTVEKYLQRQAEKRAACENTCTITRPLTPEDLVDVMVVKPEPEPIHERNAVDDNGKVVSLKKTYFSGHPEPIVIGEHRGRHHKPEALIVEDKHKVKKTWKQRRMELWKLLEKGLKKVGLAYDE